MNESKQSSSTTKKRRKILLSSSIMTNEEDNDGEDDERKIASRPRYNDFGDRNISFTGAGNKQPHGNNGDNIEDQDRPRRRKICSSTTSNVGLGRLKKSDSDPSSASDDHNDGSEEGTFSSSSDHEDRDPDRDRTLSSRHGARGGAAAAASAGRPSDGAGNQYDHNDWAVAQSRQSDCHHHRRQRSHGHGRTTSSQSTLNSYKYDPPLILSIEEAQKRIKRLSHEELIVASRRALHLHLQHQFLKQTKANTEAAAAASSVAASSSLSKDQKCGAAAALSSSRSSSDKPSDEEEDQMNKKISSSQLQKQTKAGWKIDSSYPKKTEASATKYTHDEDPVPTVEQLEIQARLQEKALYVAQENPSLAQALLHFAAIASGMTQSPFYNPNFVQQAAASLIIGQPTKLSAAANSAAANGTDQVPQTVSAKARPEDILASAMAVAAAGSGSDQAGDSNDSHGEGSGSGGSGSNDQKTTSGALSSLSSSVLYRSKEETTSSSSGDDHNYEKKKEHQINKKRRTTSDARSDTCYNSNEGRLSSLSSSNNNANDAAAAQDSKLFSPQDAGKVQTFIDASGGASVPMSGLSASNSDPSGSTGSSDDKKPSATKNESHAHAEEGSADNGHNRHKHRTSNLEGHLNRQGRKIAFKEMQQQGGAKDQRINKEEYGKNDLLGEESVSSGVTSEDGGVSSSLSGSTNTNDKQPSVSSDQAVCSRSSGSSGQQQRNQDHNRRNHSSSHTSISPLQQGVAFDLTSRGKRKEDKLIASTEQQLLKDRYKFEWEQMLSERPESSNVHGITKWLLRLFDLATLSQAASEAGIAVTNPTRSSSNEGNGDLFEDEEAGARNSVRGRQPNKDVANDSTYEASTVAAKGHSHRRELENPNTSSTHPHEKASNKRVKTSLDSR